MSTGSGAPVIEVRRALGLREGDDLADVALLREERDGAVDAGREAAVRRRAVLERLQHVAELQLCVVVADASGARKTRSCISRWWIRMLPLPISQPLQVMS